MTFQQCILIWDAFGISKKSIGYVKMIHFRIAAHSEGSSEFQEERELLKRDMLNTHSQKYAVKTISEYFKCWTDTRSIFSSNAHLYIDRAKICADIYQYINDVCQSIF